MTNNVRLNLVMPEHTADRINKLRGKTDAMSKADVVKDALRLYEVIVDDVLNGKEILSRDKEGNLTTYRIFVADTHESATGTER